MHFHSIYANVNSHLAYSQFTNQGNMQIMYHLTLIVLQQYFILFTHVTFLFVTILFRKSVMINNKLLFHLKLLVSINYANVIHMSYFI